MREHFVRRLGSSASNSAALNLDTSAVFKVRAARRMLK